MSLKLFQRPGSPYWYIRGEYLGQSIYASTKARDKADARRFKTDLELKIAQSAGRKRGAATFKEAAALYLEAKPGVARQWRVSINKLCDVIGDRFLADIRQFVLVDAANFLYPHCQPISKNCRVFTPAAAVLHYAAENNLCPHIKVKKMKEKKPEPRGKRKDEAARLIAGAEGKFKFLLVFLFYQGWRIADTLRLQWQDINLTEESVRYHITKTDEWLEMPLHPVVLRMLREEGPGVGFVFPWRGRTSVYIRLKKLCKDTGIYFTPHMARHSFATWLNAEGASVFEIMKAGGWRDHRSVFRYTNVDMPRVRATINKLRI